MQVLGALTAFRGSDRRGCFAIIDKDISTAKGFAGDSYGKESARNAGDTSSISGSGRSAGEGKSNPLQYPCLGNPVDRGAWGNTSP